MAKRKRLSPAQGLFLNDEPDLPSEAPFPTALRSAPPIATAASDSAAIAAAEEMAETLRLAREEGRMVVSLPLDQVVSDYLVRDRLAIDEDEMQALVESLRHRGQQTPVEVSRLDGNRYGLISGWRRLRALQHLLAETGEARFAAVQALIRRPEDASDAYLAMVEENEIRVGLSYYERARIAAKAVEQGVFPDSKEALLALYRSASRPKRSKIRSFLTIVAALDGVLHFPEALGERAGLVLAKALEEEPALAGRIAARLSEAPPVNFEAEQSLIRGAMAGQGAPVSPGSEPADPSAAAAPLRLERLRDGAVRISGPRVDAEFVARLEAWLFAQE